MKNIQLSIEELLFLFYSEGFFEQAMSIKEAYFQTIQDEELKLMLEVSTRSLLAKDMLNELDNQYKLKEEFTSFIHTLNNAERTVKASKHRQDFNGEDSISIHFKSGEAYLHKVLYDYQVHSISKLQKAEILPVITAFFNLNKLEKQGEVILKLKSEEFEELLEDVSKSSSSSMPTIQKWISKKGESNNIIQFLEDLSKRNGKMDSLVSLMYNSEKNPDLISLYFIVPGNEECWLITRENNDDLSIKRANEASINKLLFTNNVSTV